MDYTLLNEKLKVLSSLRRGKPVFKTNTNGEEGDQTWEEVYQFTPDIFVKLTIEVDSYGENEYIKGIQFVKPIIKTITDFESI